MISRILFQSLNYNQKLYKITQCVRETEFLLADKNMLILDKIKAYLSYINDDSDKKRLSKAAEIINNYINNIENLSGRTEQIGKLNCCYYELLTLTGKSVREGDFRIHVKKFDNDRPSKRLHVSAILDNLRSAFNVGSIFRSADCFGTSELALCGITVHPPSHRLEKTAMGSEKFILWKYFKNTKDAVKYFRDAGYIIAAVETIENSTPLYEMDNFENIAFVFGNEEFGITEDILSVCDTYIEIPLIGAKNSMNVASSFAVVMYEAVRQDASIGIKNGLTRSL